MTGTERLAERLKEEIERTHGVEINQGEVLNIIRVHLGENKLCLTSIREMGD
jgi:hypothetical protein